MESYILKFKSRNRRSLQNFLENVFGWKVEKWDGPDDYWLVQTGEEADGIDGGLMKSPDGETRTVNVIHVDSVDEYTSKIEAEGGRIVVPKMPILGWDMSRMRMM
ncbi:VOC family protein [Pseudalkalibacillus sp. R45]|uniref:VOC family protein n=1 Tax=Pseudalkalibacillus sp. R45 TaxID=3457433 RepID=UPI003FCD3409